MDELKSGPPSDDPQELVSGVVGLLMQHERILNDGVTRLEIDDDALESFRTWATDKFGALAEVISKMTNEELRKLRDDAFGRPSSPA